MPCSSSDGMGSGPDYSDLRRVENETTRVRQQLDMVTALLCAMYRHLENSGQGVPPEAKDWWEAHKNFDQQQGR